MAGTLFRLLHAPLLTPIGVEILSALVVGETTGQHLLRSLEKNPGVHGEARKNASAIGLKHGEASPVTTAAETLDTKVSARRQESLPTG